MNPWQATFFGLKQIPRELTALEIEAFFTFTATERQVIEKRRRRALKLGLALQIGFLRMSGRVLDAVRIVPAVLWRHRGEQFNVAAPDLASLRAMYGRGNTLFEHQHPTNKAFAELGKAIKTIFLCRYLHSEALRREIHEGLNVVEQWNGATDFVFFARRGEMASNRREASMLSLHLIQNYMVYINTLMI